MEFHISRSIRERLDLNEVLFSFTGNVVFANVAAARKLAQDLNELRDAEVGGAAETPEQKIAGQVNAGALFAMGMIDELSHALVARYRREQDPAVMAAAVKSEAAARSAHGVFNATSRTRTGMAAIRDRVRILGRSLSMFLS